MHGQPVAAAWANLRLLVECSQHALAFTSMFGWRTGREKAPAGAEQFTYEVEGVGSVRTLLPSSPSPVPLGSCLPSPPQHVCSQACYPQRAPRGGEDSCTAHQEGSATRQVRCLALVVQSCFERVLFCTSCRDVLAPALAQRSALVPRTILAVIRDI